MVTGASMHVEIWAKDRWDLYTTEVANKITQLAESLMEF
jgi:DNA-binding transcriptional regulator/RsmH inhibitor MraZ